MDIKQKGNRMNFTIQQIEQYAASTRFREGLAIPSGKSIKFSMLGQGEYNINYLFTHPVNGKKLVLRINTGSQMHLPDQIGYEYYALKLLENSTRTPKPYYLDSENHLLVMEYLPGWALDYRTDLKLAAECLAQIHSVNVPEDCHLICPDDPLDAMLNECQQMAEVYLRSDKGEKKTKEMLCRLLDTAKKHSKKEQQMSRCIINTELNSGNFLINGEGKNNYLIDWEKPLIGEAAQDLGHFLAPTTTYWKTDVLLTKEQKHDFVKQYQSCCKNTVEYEELQYRTDRYETMTCLRGVTWCAMAWVEYQDPNRPIQNQATYQKIRDYLTEDFLNWIWNSYFA